MKRLALAAPALLLLAAFAAGCKGGAGATASGGSGGQAQATAGGGLGAGERTDRAPVLIYVDQQRLHAVRELELSSHDGALHKYREVLRADGQGNVRLEVDAEWDAAAQAWVAPSQLLESLYHSRTFHLLRHRDLRLKHPHAYYSNYEWLPQPGVEQVAGVDCHRTRARSLRGDGDVELLHAVADGLLLGWTLWDSAGQNVTARLTTVSLDLAPDLSGVLWAQDQVLDEEYRPEIHDAQLGMQPRATEAPPAGFYLARRTFVDSGNLGVSVSDLYIEEWTDGLRSLFLAQHKEASTPDSIQALRRISRSQEGGIRVAEAQFGGIHAFALGHLPTASLELALAGLLH